MVRLSVEGYFSWGRPVALPEGYRQVEGNSKCEQQRVYSEERIRRSI